MRTFYLLPYKYRLAFFLLPAVLGLVAVSWWQSSSQQSMPGVSSEEAFADSLSRTRASNDRALESLQSHLKDEPDDWAALSQLGIAYLQKARDTGDPSFYQKADGVFDKVLSLQPADYTAVAGMGALSLARHQFRGGAGMG